MRTGVLLALVALLCLARPAVALDCETVAFEGTSFDTCTVELGTDDLRLWWQGPDGTPLMSLGRLADHVAEGGGTLGFAMNAGMYHPDRSPVGHLIVDGQEHRGVMTRAGPGNFGMLPNGVFCWGATQAQVVESRAYARTRPDCRFATQSGPMLVIGGELHPRFLADSTSRRLRNGVGVREDGTQAVFAISRRPVTFHTFARFMRDRMKAPDALYLDGTVSRMYAPLIGRTDRGGRFGPMLGVVSGR